MSTEARNPRSIGLDKMSAKEIVRLMNEEEHAVLRALATAEETIAVIERGGLEDSFSNRLPRLPGLLQGAVSFENRSDQRAAIQRCFGFGGRTDPVRGVQELGRFSSIGLNRRCRQGDRCGQTQSDQFSRHDTPFEQGC